MVPNAVTTGHYCQIQLRPGGAVTPSPKWIQGRVLIVIVGVKPYNSCILQYPKMS